MRRFPGVFALLLVAGCGGGGGGSDHGSAGSPSRPIDRIPDPPSRNQDDDDVLAIVNGRKITRKEVLDRTLDLDFRGTVNRYISWRLIVDRRKELKVQNSKEDLAARAKVAVARSRQQLGEAQYAKLLDGMKMNEAEYTDWFAATPELNELLAKEKMVVYDMLKEGFTRADFIFFGSFAEADAYRKWLDTAGGEKAPARPTEEVKGVRVNASMYPTMLPPQVRDEVLKSDFGTRLVSQMATGTGGIVVIVRDRKPPMAGSVEEKKKVVLDDILASPPDEHELSMWLQSLWQKAKVEYPADRRPKGD